MLPWAKSFCVTCDESLIHSNERCHPSFDCCARRRTRKSFETKNIASNLRLNSFHMTAHLLPKNGKIHIDLFGCVE